MRLLSVVTLLGLAFLVVPARAADEAPKKPVGAFTKTAGDFKLTFDFAKKGDTFQFTMVNNDGDGCVIDAKYTRDKDGTVKAEVTKFEKKGNFPVEKDKGYKFSFKALPKDKKLVIADVEGDDISAEAKDILQGDYEAAKK